VDGCAVPSERVEPLNDSGTSRAEWSGGGLEIEPLINAPENVTPLGAIAYRVDAVAQRLADLEIEHEACILWGIVDDLVAYGQDHAE